MNTEFARSAVGFIAARSVSFSVSSAVKNLVLPRNGLEKIQLSIGAFVIGGMVADHALHWSQDQFDSTIRAARVLKARMNESETEDENYEAPDIHLAKDLEVDDEL